MCFQLVQNFADSVLHHGLPMLCALPVQLGLLFSQARLLFQLQSSSRRFLRLQSPLVLFLIL